MAPVTPYSTELEGREPIAAMRATSTRIHELVAPWAPAQMERGSAPGKWSVRQILVHLAQTELALGARARMALTTPHYVAQSFEPDPWVARETALGAEAAVEAFVTLSRMNVALFASLSETDRQISFSHPQYGTLTVDWLIHQMAGHQIHHLKQLETVQ